MRKQIIVGRIYEMQYSWRGHTDKNTHKNRIKRSGQAMLVSQGHKTRHTHYLGGELAGTCVYVCVCVCVLARAHLHVPGLSTNRACPILFILFLCLFLSLWPFQLYFIPLILPTTFRFLTLFFWSYFCLVGPFNYIYISFYIYLSLWKSSSTLI